MGTLSMWARANGQRAGSAKRHEDAKAYAHGERLSLVEWGERVGVSAKVLADRIIGGMTSEQAVSMPAQRPARGGDREHTDMACELQLIADELGVTRQAIEQAQLRGSGRFQRSFIAAKCIAWRSEFGEELTDDEIADIIVAIADDLGLRRKLFASDFDVGELCNAMLMLRGQQEAA